MDPNILSRRPTGKSQAAEQAIPRALPPIDYNSSEAPISDSAASAAGSLMHVTRPSLTGIASFQRPRKRVLWRNKACFIALPLEDEFGRKTSRETYLGRDDFQTRLEKWKDQGFDTNGFTLLSPSSASNPLSEGQSRTVHPDPEDVKRERADGIYHVNIPERRHWVCVSLEIFSCSTVFFMCKICSGSRIVLCPFAAFRCLGCRRKEY